VIGSMTDLSAASEQDVKDFFRLYYAPNNATLTLVGDFDAAQAKTWIAKYFGEIPRGKAITRPAVKPVTLAEEKRFVYEDRVQIPRLYMSWPTVGVKHPDDLVLDVLSNILSGPRTARLTKALVYDRQSAASVNTFQATSEDVGDFYIILTPRPGHTLTELELATDSILDRLKREGPTDEEVQRAKAGIELNFVTGLESNLGKSSQLADGLGTHGDPAYYKTVYRRSLAVTAADVKRVASKYLSGGRVALSIVPQGKKEEASKYDKSVTVSDAGANR
jgi:zinc protease